MTLGWDVKAEQDDTTAMSIFETVCRLDNAVECLRDTQRPVLVDDSPQVSSIDELHDEHMRVIEFVEIVGTDNIGVIQLRRGNDFALKSLNGILVLRHGRRKQLQGNGPLHFSVSGFENDPHTAPPEFVFDDVISEDELLGLVMPKVPG